MCVPAVACIVILVSSVTVCHPGDRQHRQGASEHHQGGAVQDVGLRGLFVSSSLLPAMSPNTNIIGDQPPQYISISYINF